MSTHELKCVIAGYGYMGEIRRRVIEASPHLSLAGICESNETTRAKISGTTVVSSFEELLEIDSDIVFVCLPNCFAPEATVRSLQAGKHVFCEKPPGRNVKDIEDMRTAEKAAPGLKLMFGFNHRYHPSVLKALSIIKSGRLGRVLGLRGVYGKSGGIGFPGSWRNDKSVSGGGILLDQGIHMLDLFRYFCGDFEYVKCYSDNSCWNFEVEDNAFVVLHNEQGQHAMLHSSATLWKHTFQMNIIMDHGYLILDGLLSRTGSYGREKLVIARKQFEDEAQAVGNPSEEVVYFDRDMSWQMEMDEFVQCIIDDKPVQESSSYDALRAMKIVEAAYLDAETPGARTL